MSGIKKSLCSLAQSYFKSPKNICCCFIFWTNTKQRDSQSQKYKQAKCQSRRKSKLWAWKWCLYWWWWWQWWNWKTHKSCRKWKDRQKVPNSFFKLIRSTTNTCQVKILTIVTIARHILCFRSGDSRAMAMMKRLGNVTGILQGKLWVGRSNS